MYPYTLCPKNSNLQLREDTGIPYNEMLFFDDCLRTDYCAIVAKNCPGVVTQATPEVSQSIARLLFCLYSVAGVNLLPILSAEIASRNDIYDIRLHRSFAVVV